MSDKTSPGILRSFPPVFWVANVMELFERGAYYGMNSVLAIYLSDSVATGGLGFSEQSVGFLQGLIYALHLHRADPGRRARRPVRLPPDAAGRLLVPRRRLLRDRPHDGLRRGLREPCSSWRPASGLFKPIISGTIARSTNERTPASASASTTG